MNQESSRPFVCTQTGRTLGPASLKLKRSGVSRFEPADAQGVGSTFSSGRPLFQNGIVWVVGFSQGAVFQVCLSALFIFESLSLRFVGSAQHMRTVPHFVWRLSHNNSRLSSRQAWTPKRLGTVPKKSKKNTPADSSAVGLPKTRRVCCLLARFFLDSLAFLGVLSLSGLLFWTQFRTFWAALQNARLSPKGNSDKPRTVPQAFELDMLRTLLFKF